MAPMRKIDFSHFPLCVKVFLMFLKNCLNGIGSSLDLGVLTRKEHEYRLRLNKIQGFQKMGRNQTIPAIMEPKIGLNTFPKVLEVSISPKVLLISSSLLNKSPTKGMTIGAAPAAPTPCKALPNKTIQ